jgi:hypothetical protein
MRQITQLLSIALFLVFGLTTVSAQMGQYSIRYDAGTQKYTVYAKINTAYAVPQSRFLNVFVTVMAPTGSGATQFLPSTVTADAALGSSAPIAVSRINAPSWNSSKDYIFFNFDVGSSNYTPAPIIANTEFAIFSFGNSNGCLAGSINILTHGDADYNAAQANSQNASNALEIFGAGGETYTSNYGTANVTCAVAATPPTITVGFAPSPMTAGQNATMTLTATNSAGNPAQTGMGYTYTLPSGLTFPAGATVTNSCGGTAVVTNSTTLTFTGGSMTSGSSNCTISVPVVAASSGTINPGAGVIGSPVNVTPGANNGAGAGATPITVNPAVSSCAANAGTLTY